MTGGNCRIVGILKFIDSAFQRQITEHGVPFRQQCGLPKPCHTPVAILEGMDEHKFVMEDGRQNQRMDDAALSAHPVKKRFHLFRYKLRRRHENTGIAVKHALVMASENTGFLHCQIGHHAVQPFKLRQRKGIEFTQQVICLIRILDLLDFLLRSDHRLTAEHAFDFVQRKRICLNRQRGMN